MAEKIRPPEEAAVRTFREVGKKFVRAQESGWKTPVHRAQWRSTLETYAFATLGDMPVNAIATMHVRVVLEPVWTSRAATADRVRGRIERTLASAKALGLRSGENPAAWKENLADLLPPPRKVRRPGHHGSLPWKRCPAFVASFPISALSIHVSTRPGGSTSFGQTAVHDDECHATSSITASGARHIVFSPPAVAAALRPFQKLCSDNLYLESGHPAGLD